MVDVCVVCAAVRASYVGVTASGATTIRGLIAAHLRALAVSPLLSLPGLVLMTLLA